MVSQTETFYKVTPQEASRLHQELTHAQQSVYLHIRSNYPFGGRVLLNASDIARKMSDGAKKIARQTVSRALKVLRDKRFLHVNMVTVMDIQPTEHQEVPEAPPEVPEAPPEVPEAPSEVPEAPPTHQVEARPVATPTLQRATDIKDIKDVPKPKRKSNFYKNGQKEEEKPENVEMYQDRTTGAGTAEEAVLIRLKNKRYHDASIIASCHGLNYYEIADKHGIELPPNGRFTTKPISDIINDIKNLQLSARGRKSK